MAGKVVDKKNITGGSARIIVATPGTTKPVKFGDIFDVGDALKAGYRDIGATDGGVTLSRGYDKESWEVDQVLGTIDEFVTDWNMGLETSLAETDIENLKLAWNLDTETVDTVTTPDEATIGINANTEITERMVIVQVDKRTIAGTIYKRLYVFWRAKYDGSDVSQSFQKGAKVLLPIKFNLLADPSENIGTAFGKVIDQVYV